MGKEKEKSKISESTSKWVAKLGVGFENDIFVIFSSFRKSDFNYTTKEFLGDDYKSLQIFRVQNFIVKFGSISFEYVKCSHSNLPQIMDGIKAIERNIKRPIDELVLENNQLPALPGRFFGNLQIVRLMLRHNSIERVSNGWLNELENSLIEIYIVEPELRSIPVESLNGMINMVAITIQSDELKHFPDFSGLLNLAYLNVHSLALTELQFHWFRHLPKLQDVHVTGSARGLHRLESGLFDGLIAVKNIDLSRNGINWIHLRALTRLPSLMTLKLSYNQISDVGMIGRIVKDLESLKKLRLDHNIINIIEDGSFVDLPYLSELHLNDNRITEIEYGAFLRTPMLKTIYLHNNHIKRIHPESFLQASGSGVETMYIYNNEIEHVTELRSLLEALPALKFLDISNNYLKDIHFGALRGHGTLEQLHINNNLLRNIERDALMAMPALRELRLRNNSLSHELSMPFWNLPGLKGLDLSMNNFRWVDSLLLAGLPSLRRLDLSENGLIKLDPTIFIHNPMLETLNISANELVSIHAATFRNLDHLFEVDASFNQLLEIIPGLPKIVERISVRGNFISSLPPVNTKTLNLPNLRMLDLSLNRLEQLPKYGFQALPQLRVLSMANNRLHAVSDTAFTGSYRLELLHLQENQLSLIDERAFLPLSQLRNLNLRSNKLQAITDNLFSNNTKLEQLDLSHNAIRTIATTAFESQRSLEYLDISFNSLSDVSISLSNLVNLRSIDLSYNQITQIHAEIVSAWRDVTEIRLSNNLISGLKQSTFRNLPKLQYLDLSSNEINSMEAGALKNLPDLQEYVLADNKLVELKDHAFEDLPNLLAVHFQYNNLRDMSADSFFNSPSIVFLNLSNNHFHNIESIGLSNMRNLEVLDLSHNAIRVISTMPLRSLNWLVELKMDDNEICKVQGSPFETMPRLRVLSMRNNRLKVLRERTFRNLRGNIAIIDIDGNPIDCSCEISWLSVWLQETNFPYPGPKCQDGRLLRSSNVDKKLCSNYGGDHSQKSDLLFGAEVENLNNLPLLNDHGDIFQRDLNEKYIDECETHDIAPVDRPLAGESEYFYDQYIDYQPTNQTNSNVVTDIPALGSQLESTNTALSSHKKIPSSASTAVDSNIDLNNTILNTNFFKRKPTTLTVPTNNHPSSSTFTFFGYPLPSLSLGRFFGAQQGRRKDRGESTLTSTPTSSLNIELPATHRIGIGTNGSGHGKVRMYQPNSAEFEKYLKRKDKPSEVRYQKQKQPSEHFNGHRHNQQFSSDEISFTEGGERNNENPASVFKTGFHTPAHVEKGGFRPMIPHLSVGGFKPIPDPSKRKGTIEVVNTSAKDNKRHYVPIVTENTPLAIAHKPPLDNGPFNPENETHTYFITESKGNENIATTPGSVNTTTLLANPSTPLTQLNSTTRYSNTTESYETDTYDDLDTQPVGFLKPPSLVETTTSETILLIPPSEELVEHLKRQTWLFTTQEIDNEETNQFVTTSTITTTPGSLLDINSVGDDTNAGGTTTSKFSSAYMPRPGGAARSTITKVYTPQTSNKFLPTAEGYEHTSSTPDRNNVPNQSTNQPQITANAQKRKHSVVYNNNRKDGMDWYYESFKKTRPIVSSHKFYTGSGSSSLRSSATFHQNLYTIELCLIYILISTVVTNSRIN
uniref:LRRCT domain-containing protein n=1 Tax=Glossina brevipalpis TaxID=37001 RepID=A0A1A9W4E0_9MUSC